MGNIDSLRDWGHAKDYVRMQWLMLQQDIPEDFVIATGKQYSVREFINFSRPASNLFGGLDSLKDRVRVSAIFIRLM